MYIMYNIKLKKNSSQPDVFSVSVGYMEGEKSKNLLENLHLFTLIIYSYCLIMK